MSSQLILPNTEAAIFTRLLESQPKMTPAVAEYFLSIDFGGPDLDRMNLLAELAREGTLTSEESIELDRYLEVGTFLSILQARARRLLRSPNSKPAR